MPGALDNCINSIYEPGNIPASSGIPPVRVLLRDPLAAAILEAAAAVDDQSVGLLLVAIIETAAADSVQDATGASGRSAMIAGLVPVYVNGGTPREANVLGTMVNL